MAHIGAPRSKHVWLILHFVTYRYPISSGRASVKTCLLIHEWSWTRLVGTLARAQTSLSEMPHHDLLVVGSTSFVTNLIYSTQRGGHTRRDNTMYT
jgi:hypothetical protein